LASRFNLDDVRPGEQVLLFCLVGSDQTAVVAQRHWFEETVGDHASERRLWWRITWDGAPLPANWSPYAYQPIEAPDLAQEDVI
jgi:hypothetical protein